MANLTGNNLSGISVSRHRDNSTDVPTVRYNEAGVPLFAINAREEETSSAGENRFQKVGMAPDEFRDSDTIHCIAVE